MWPNCGPTTTVMISNMANVNFNITNSTMNATVTRLSSKAGKHEIRAIATKEGENPNFLAVHWEQKDYKPHGPTRQVNIYLSRVEAQSLIESLQIGIEQLDKNCT